MKRALYSPPDSFSLMPFTVVLPVIGSVSNLESLVPSLFARLEKIEELLRTRAVASEGAETLRRLEAEQAMLKTSLTWITQTGSTRGESS
jgi:hypothetical protein